MSERETYQAGVPCWVDNLVPDPKAAMRFYEELLGWEFFGPGPGDYHVAHVRGRDVAGLGAQPPGVPAAWNTYVSVESAGDSVRAAARAGGNVMVEPVDALPAGRVAVVADPSGAVLGLWEPHERKGAQIVNEPSAWSMSIVNTPDPDACAAFYREVFGWESEPFGPMTLFRLPGCVTGEPQQPVPRDVVAAMAPSDAAGGAYWGINFWVSDADAVAEKAPALGGSVVAPPFDGGGMRTAVVADTDGAAFSVTTAPGG